MRCVKCGVMQTNINLDRRSCRIHNNDGSDSCNRCTGFGNCHHDWVYFFNFWHMVRILKLFFIRRTPVKLSKDYVEL